MSLDSNSRRQRGTTLVEMLIATGMLGLFLTLGVVLVAPVLSASDKLQSKADTLQSAAAGLYRIQRDVRMSGISGDYACTASGTVTCQQYSSLTQTPAVAILSAQSGNQLTYDSSGLPTWQGVIVYWVAGSDLNKAFGSFPSPVQAPATPSPTAIQFAAAQAFASSTASVAVPNVAQILVDFNTAHHIVGLKLVSVGNERGRVNETSFESDTYARN